MTAFRLPRCATYSIHIAHGWSKRRREASKFGLWPWWSEGARRVIRPFTTSHFRRPAAAVRTYSDLPL
jgi:hypothetical protein